MLKLSMLIQLTERVTAPVRRIRTAIRGMVVTGERDVKRLDRMMARLSKTAESIGRAIGRTIRWGALAAGGAIVGFGTSIIRTASQFEQFQVVLENTEGSAAGAKKAMAWVTDFAKRTPYELSDVMQAFVQMKAYGIDPTSGALESLGNAASGMNKDLMAAVEMLADAQTGEFERLKEFGVRAKQQGEKVTFTYMKAGKEVSVTAKKSAAEIQKAITGIFDSRFKGMMDRQSRTLGGLWSNLKDMLASFEVSVANAGFFDYVKGQIQRLLDWVNKLAANGTLQRWAKEISDRLIQLGEKLKTIDWAAIASGIAGIANAIVGVVKFAGKIESTFGLFNLAIVAIVAKIAFGMYGLATALGVVSVAGAPLWAVVAIIAAIAAGAILVWKNWDKITAWFAKTWASLKTTFQQGAAALWSSLPWWLQKIFQGVAFAIKFNPISAGINSLKYFFGGDNKPAGGAGGGRPGGTAPRGPFAPGPARRQPGNGSMLFKQTAVVGGKIDLTVKTDRGSSVRVDRMASNNNRVPLAVRGSAGA